VKDNLALGKMKHLLEIKTLLRRAVSYDKLNELDKAQEDVINCEKLIGQLKLFSNQETNIEFKEMSDSVLEIKDKIKATLLQNYIDNANSFLKEKKFADALEVYNKALNLNKVYKNQLENCKLLINRSSCFISLLQYTNAINELSRVLIVLQRYRSVCIINKEGPVVMDQISNLEFLCYVRRAAACTFEKKLTDAAQDYEKALQIKDDSVIRSN
jgi:tetratricopeptide (TPR) repeat protein